MRVQDVCKAVIKSSGQTQKEIAERHGKSGQSSISMMFQSRSMRVDSLLMILNECGYDLVARSRNASGPSYVIGDDLDEDYLKTELKFDDAMSSIRQVISGYVKDMVLEEMSARKNSDDVAAGGKEWNKYLKESMDGSSYREKHPLPEDI